MGYEVLRVCDASDGDVRACGAGVERGQEERGRHPSRCCEGAGL